ncbi:MAG: nucleotide exchange factor GrpE [Planctomycetes bacterium]|nr:nucleotide exchange factor GrpE [Planctomycetota bacterium]
MTKKHEDKMKDKKEKHKSKNKENFEQQIEVLQKEKDELLGKLQRVSADYANFQKRAPRQIAESIAYEKESIIRTLLPVLDNFEHTLHNAAATENIEALLKGIRIVYDQMLDVLKSHGAEQIKAAGENFNPATHQAVMQKVEPEQPDNIVLEEFQKGYKIKDRVIRPSKVIVNKLPQDEDSQQSKANEENTEKIEDNQ